MSSTSYVFPKDSAEVRKFWTLGQRRQAVRELALQQWREQHPGTYLRGMALLESADQFLINIEWSTTELTYENQR